VKDKVKREASHTVVSRTGGSAVRPLPGSPVVVPTRLYEAYIFDLDGTIYLGPDLLPGAKRLIGELRARDKPVRFLSNNPTRDRDMYVSKLTKLGIPARVEDIVNTVVTMTRWLLANHPDAVVFPIAEQPLIRALDEAGIRMSDNPAEIDIVIASYDRGFEYRKLQIAFDAIWYYKRARLVATNPDPYCPMDGGRGEPDAAAVIAAIVIRSLSGPIHGTASTLIAGISANVGIISAIVRCGKAMKPATNAKKSAMAMRAPTLKIPPIRIDAAAAPSVMNAPPVRSGRSARVRASQDGRMNP